MPIFEDVNFHLELGQPPEEILEYAKLNIGETEENKTFMLSELRELVYERGDVTPHRIDDSFLLRFLRARNFHLESAYKLMVNYYTFKEKNPNYHVNVNPIKLRFIGDEDVIQVLPYREATGRRIMIFKFGNWNPQSYSVAELFKATLSVLELGVLEQRQQILGGVCIFDLDGISMAHARQVTPGIAQKIFDLMVTSFPLKVASLHVIFESWVFDIMYNVFKPLLDERMRTRIYFHGNSVESLHKHIEPKYLPSKYGGDRPNYRYNRWIENFRTTPEIVREVLSLGYVIDKEDLENEFYKSDDEDNPSS